MERGTAPNQLGEAPASVTYSVTSKNGFNALVTSRASTFSDLFKQMHTIEDLLVKAEYKPQIKQGFGTKKEIEYVEGRVCPKDNGRLVKKTKKDGGIYYTCENYKYDFTTKTNTGKCDYIDWLK